MEAKMALWCVLAGLVCLLGWLISRRKQKEQLAEEAAESLRKAAAKVALKSSKIRVKKKKEEK